MGPDPMDERELPFVYEKEIKVLPTAVAVLASAKGGSSEPAPNQRAGLKLSHLNWLTLVHGEQKIEMRKPLPSFGTFRPPAAPSAPTTTARIRARVARRSRWKSASIKLREFRRARAVGRRSPTGVTCPASARSARDRADW
ncbi:hypothetical protein [Bradyrhizobium sp. 23AC]